VARASCANAKVKLLGLTDEFWSRAVLPALAAAVQRLLLARS